MTFLPPSLRARCPGVRPSLQKKKREETSVPFVFLRNSGECGAPLRSSFTVFRLQEARTIIAMEEGFRILSSFSMTVKIRSLG